MTLLRRYDSKEGYVPIVDESQSVMKRIGFGLIYLGEGMSFEGNTGDREAGLILLSGKCTIEGEAFRSVDIGERQTVFLGKPYAVYLPCSTSYKITSKTWVDMAICTAPSDRHGEVKVITPSDVDHRSLGQLNWRRDVNFIIDSRTNAKNLYVGETILPPGHWTFPPHCHDVDSPPNEVDMEEVYFYRTRPSEGFGLQVVYTEDSSTNETYIVRYNDIVMIPRGFHPAVASPGDSLYILWIMAGEKRLFLSRPDPRYEWLDNWESLIQTLDK